MKARLLLDQWADITKVTEELRAKIVPVMFCGKLDWKFPEGTIFEGEQAVFMCRTGQCEPLDDECIEALNIPKDRRAVLQINYKMSSLGINSKEDRALYRAGVIEGYDEHLKYIPGPNWAAYMKAKEATKKSGDEIE
jgi:hypothetical protein